MNKQNAEQDIKFIREVLNRTQRDISGIGMCFIWIGLVNLFGEVLKNIGYSILDAQKEISSLEWQILRSIDGISFVIICVIFLICFVKLFRNGNDISKSILKIWGVLLIGGRIFTKIFVNLALQKQASVTVEFAVTLEKAFSFLCIIIALTVLGIVIHDKLICGSALLGIVIYCLLLNWGRGFTVAQVHGNSINMYSQDIFSIFTLSFGMIFLGLYARINGRKKRGDS